MSFWVEIAIYLYLGIREGHLSYRRSLQPSKENILHFKHEISSLFLILWVIFALLDLDPSKKMRIRIQIRNIVLSMHCI
jgi:hypothetical protein